MAKSGAQSPTSFSRTMEKVFEDAQYSGVINLSNRKLKDYPKYKKKYDLADTSSADLSRNRLMEIPPEVCEFPNLERLNVYNNVIRCLPQALVQLQSLVHLNISRNQLSYLPSFICHLKALEVLLASNNHLVSLPEEIGELQNLMDIDISCNEITHLPTQIGDLDSLKSLNVRRNMLVELPPEMSRVELQTLDISSNRIKELPRDFRHMESLETLRLQNNPLESPPAHICTKGRVHIMKYLQNEAIKEDRKKGILHDMELKHTMRPVSLPPSLSEEFRHLGDTTSDKRKRRTVDSGYSTTDSSERSRYSPSEWLYEVSERSVASDLLYHPHIKSLISGRAFRRLDDAVLTSAPQLRNHSPISGHRDNSTTVVRAAEHVKESRLEREQQKQQHVMQPSDGLKASGVTPRTVALPAPLNLHTPSPKSNQILDFSTIPPITPTHVFIEPNYSPIRSASLPQSSAHSHSPASRTYASSSASSSVSSQSASSTKPSSGYSSQSPSSTSSPNQSIEGPIYLQTSSPRSPSFFRAGPAHTSSPATTPTAPPGGDDANLFAGYQLDQSSLVDEFTRVSVQHGLRSDTHGLM